MLLLAFLWLYHIFNSGKYLVHDDWKILPSYKTVVSTKPVYVYTLGFLLRKTLYIFYAVSFSLGVT